MRVSGEKIDMTQKNERTLVIIPGDGIGPEIIGQASRVVEWFDRHRGLGLDIKERPLGVNVPVIAWGLGVDRMAMVALGIDDIRDLFSSDLDFVRNERG